MGMVVKIVVGQAGAAASGLRGAEFGEDTVGELGVEEGHHLAGGTLEGHLVDEFHAGGRGLLELGGKIGGGEGDVMHAAGRVLLEELGDGAVGRGRLEQFQVGFTGVEEGRAHLLRGDFLAVFAGEAQGFFEIRDRFIQ